MAGERISLVSPKGDSVDSLRYPDMADLMSRLHFSPGDGRIWLDDQRMLLAHTGSVGVMRRELIESLGIGAARGLLTRVGYNSGARDAELARKVRPDSTITEMLAVGPQLHMLEGMTFVETVRLEIDVEKEKYYGEFIWKNCAEDEEHIRIYGIGAEPVCWTQIGYASGYTSVFMGRPMLYREVECRALGQAQCRIVGNLFIGLRAEVFACRKWHLPTCVACKPAPMYPSRDATIQWFATNSCPVLPNTAVCGLNQSS